jgi:hypothetical protein
MMKKIITYISYPILAVGITVGLLSVAYAATNSNIDPEDKWAWSTNAGWINFNPPNGGVTVCDDHLEGYAWGTNVGWINFDPDGAEGVTIDPVSGDFDGYAWGGNVGWISFNGSGPVAYKVSMLLYRIYLSLVIKGS